MIRGTHGKREERGLHFPHDRGTDESRVEEHLRMILKHEIVLSRLLYFERAEETARSQDRKLAQV